MSFLCEATYKTLFQTFAACAEIWFRSTESTLGIRTNFHLRLRFSFIFLVTIFSYYITIVFVLQQCYFS